MHSPDRYIFALAMLEGDRSARQVLADMLEEQGERGLAQWARRGRRDKRRTLEFATMLLPCRPAIGLAAEFIGKVFDTGEPLVIAAQRWARKRMEDTEAIEVCRREVAALLQQRSNSYFSDRGYAQYFAADCAEVLVSAMQRAIESEHFAECEDAGQTAARGLESRNYVRQIVRQANRLQSNLDWQTEQLRQLLKELLASEEDLWPR